MSNNYKTFYGVCTFLLYVSFINADQDKNKVKEELKTQWNEILQRTSKWTTPEDNRDFKNYSMSPCSEEDSRFMLRNLGNQARCVSSCRFRYIKREFPKYGTFDFIVVGAGSAGAVIANRLSKNSKNEVLLIEAGGEETNFSLVPLNFPHLMKTDMNWGYKTTTQKNACLIKPEGKCAYNRGKSLGGTSAINGMVMARANKDDFDRWVKMGNTEWSYEKLLKYYKRSESVSGYGRSRYRGRDGPTHVTKTSQEAYLYSALKMANAEVNIQPNRDYNGKSQIGFSPAQNNIRNGIRQSSNQAYLVPLGGRRKNLRVLTHAFATKIEFEKNRATQIKFLHEGSCKIAKVRNEIIISAGVVNSPQLLQLSGLGPQRLLKMHNIEVQKNLPVGRNFQDHPCIANGLEILTNYTLHQKSFDEELEEYVNGEGRMTSLFTSEVSFHNLENQTSSNPNIEYIYRLNHNTLTPTLTSSTYEAKFVMNIILQHSSSLGTIRIKSNDPMDYPVLDLNILDNPDEVEQIVDAFEYLDKIVQAPALQKYGARINEEPFKIEECKKFSNKREFWACIIRYLGIGCNHGSSTCSMGPDSKTSVVDQELKVHGIENLRVADASIFPISLSGQVHANVLMVGEKASDLILKDPRWKNS